MQLARKLVERDYSKQYSFLWSHGTELRVDNSLCVIDSSP